MTLGVRGVHHTHRRQGTDVERPWVCEGCTTCLGEASSRSSVSRAHPGAASHQKLGGKLSGGKPQSDFWHRWTGEEGRGG